MRAERALLGRRSPRGPRAASTRRASADERRLGLELDHARRAAGAATGTARARRAGARTARLGDRRATRAASGTPARSACLAEEAQRHVIRLRPRPAHRVAAAASRASRARDAPPATRRAASPISTAKKARTAMLGLRRTSRALLAFALRARGATRLAPSRWRRTQSIAICAVSRRLRSRSNGNSSSRAAQPAALANADVDEPDRLLAACRRRARRCRSSRRRGRCRSARRAPSAIARATRLGDRAVSASTARARRAAPPSRRSQYATTPPLK